MPIALYNQSLYSADSHRPFFSGHLYLKEVIGLFVFAGNHQPACLVDNRKFSYTVDSHKPILLFRNFTSHFSQ
jgi:hypothetical protein